MYDLPYFKAAHPDEILAFMRAHPFALICGTDENKKPVATQIPFLFEQRDDQLFLQGHFMKKQDHTRAFDSNPHALVVFSGAHAYVSASWYDDPKTASTWNYQSVHASGILRYQDPGFLHSLLERLTRTFEAPGSPALVHHMDPAYVQQMMQAIVAFEIEVTAVRHVFKLSQNRDSSTHAHIISKLRERDADAREVARAMEEKNKKPI